MTPAETVHESDLPAGRSMEEIVAEARRRLLAILCPPGLEAESIAEAVLVARGLLWLAEAPSEEVLTAYAYVEAQGRPS